MASGGIILTFSGAWMIALLTPSKYDDKMMKILYPLVVLAQFCIFMWGSILVFGWYSTWQYDPQVKDTPEYCDYSLFMYSFFMLIIGWCTLPSTIFCLCTALC